MCVFVCVSEREREIDRETERERGGANMGNKDSKRIHRTRHCVFM